MTSRHTFHLHDPSRSTDMTYDHTAAGIHRAELDREIDSIRTERILATQTPRRAGLVSRARRGTGRVLVAAGTALIGRDPATLRAHRA
jgi:hypothetical protein